MMKIQAKNNEIISYELVASAHCGQTHIYGRTLEEISALHVAVIRKAESAELRAIEQGRYARFLLEHINDYNAVLHDKKLQLAITLTECSVFVLKNSKRNKKGRYNKLISILERCRADAMKLLSAVQ